MMFPTHPFGFSAEYRSSDMNFEELDGFLRLEYKNLPSGWEPTFGKVSYFDPKIRTWMYMYLLRGSVPEARTRPAAEKKARGLAHDLGSRFRLAHANPGRFLPEPEIRVWRWS